MIVRSVSKHLSDWSLTSAPPPLLLTGARQTGKAWAIMDMAGRFSQFLHVNPGELPWKKIFMKQDGPEEILSGLFFLAGKSPAVRRSLFFFEEIQESPAAIRFVKELYRIRPGSFVAATASRLTQELNAWLSEVSERPLRLNMFPLTFSEFLGSLGDPELEKGYRELPIPAFLREKLMRKFHLYALTGGMPQVISRYLQDHHLSGLRPVYEEILQSQTVWAEAGAKNRKWKEMTRFTLQNAFPYAATRFSFASFANSPYRSREMGEVFASLEKNFLVKLIHPSVKTSVPFEKDTGRFPRLHLPDTGMVSHFSGIQKELYHTADLSELFRGQIAKQVVAQELRAADPLEDELHFWIRPKLQSTAEIDFLVRYHDIAIPVEVRPDEPGRLRSLHQFMDEAPHPYAIRLCNGPVSIRQAVTIRGRKFFLMSLPYFLAGRINEHLDSLIKFVHAV